MGPRDMHASLMCCKKHKLPTSLPHMYCAGELSHVVTVRVGGRGLKNMFCAVLNMVGEGRGKMVAERQATFRLCKVLLKGKVSVISSAGTDL